MRIKQLINYQLIRKKALHFLSNANPRERLLAVAAFVMLGGYIVTYPIIALQEYIEDTERQTIVRLRELNSINQLAKRYSTLDQRLAKVKTTFAEAEMTFEQVTKELDKIVKDSIGNDNYDLKKKSSAPTEFGLEYEKQDFSLRLRSLSLEQLVKLLYQLEHGKSPLFLSKVDIVKSAKAGEFTTTMEIYSIKKQRDNIA